MIHRIKLALITHKHFFAYFSFSVATSALGFASTLVLMHYISPEEFGKIALFVSIHFLVAPIISFSAESLIAVNRSKQSNDVYEHFRMSYVTLAYFIFVIVQIGSVVIYTTGAHNNAMFVLIPFAALLKYLIGLASIEYVMEEKSVQYGLLQLFSAAFSLALTIGLIDLFGAVADLRIFALLIADMVFLLIRYWGRMRLLLNFVFDWQQYRQIIIFGFPLLVSIAPAWVLNEVDKVIVAQYADLTSVGLYAAACAIGGFMMTFNASLMNATIPKLYSALASQPESIMAVTKLFLCRHVLVSAIFSACFAFCYDLFAEFILPEKYAAAREIVFWVILFALARSFYTIFGAVTDYLGMTTQKLKGVTLGAVAAILSMLVGIIKFGIVGVVVGVGVGYSVLGIWLWLSLVDRSRG